MDGTQEKKEVPTGLNPKYTFENFVEGDSNRIAVAVAKSVKDQTQDEFTHTLAALQHTGRQVVLASAKFPMQVANYEGRVMQLLQSGIIVSLQPPNITDRQRLLSSKWQELAYTFDAAELGFIAQKVTANNGVLLGALNSVATHVQHSGGKFDLDEIEKLLANYQSQ